MQASNDAELVVNVMMRTGCKVVNEPDVVVQKEHTVLASHTQPQLVTHNVAFGEDVISGLDVLYR